MTDDRRYRDLVRDFRWFIPERFNIAEACLSRRAAIEPERTALLRYRPGRPLEPVTYGELEGLSRRFAAVLRARGLGRGDRIGVLLPQSAAAVAAHMAAYRIGAIVVPLAALFGVEALAHRLEASGAAALVTDATGLAKVRTIHANLPDMAHIFCTDGPEGDASGFDEACATASPDETDVATAPDDPAMMIFTSGTTGTPKGTLHGHRVLIGHLPGFSFSHPDLPQAGDRFWTPSDWAWAGGLLNALLPSLFHGVPVVFGPAGKFDPEAAFRLLTEAEVRNCFMPPTALRLARTVASPRARFGFALRTLASAGESLGRETLQWSRDALGLPADEFYGQTECNYVIGSSSALAVTRPGAIGMPIPGHRVSLRDDAGNEVPPGTPGEIALHRSDPSMFLRYWNDEEATRARFRGDWMLTGDRAIRDSDGYISFVGRNDDLIISSGYRIGPTEIEDCLAAHPAVAMAAVVGKPDPIRNEVVKAYVKLRAGHLPSDQLAADIADHVRQRVSAAEYPREVAFVDDIPLTTTGKVVRRHFRDIAAREARTA